MRSLQRLSTEKLNEIDRLLTKIESVSASKEKTLSMAGQWHNLDAGLFSDLTYQVHNRRSVGENF